MNKKQQQILAFVFGVVFLSVLLSIAVFIPNPTAFQYTVFRIVLALSAAGVAAMIPGFFDVKISNWIKAGGALGVFAVVYFLNPASTVVPSQVVNSSQTITNGNNNTQVQGGDNSVTK